MDYCDLANYLRSGIIIEKYEQYFREEAACANITVDAAKRLILALLEQLGY